MKKLAAIIAITGLSFHSFASDPENKSQNNSLMASSGDGEKCFDESTHIINLGFGFGGVNYYSINTGTGYNYRRTPAISLSYEQPWKKKLGPGYLGIGAYLGFQNARYRYDDVFYGGGKYYYEHNWNYFMVAARGAYHWDVLNSKNAEVYAGVVIGLRFQTYSYNTNDPDPYTDYRLSNSAVYPAYSLFAGARWYFAKRVAVFGEVGYGISYLTAGLSFKF